MNRKYYISLLSSLAIIAVCGLFTTISAESISGSGLGDFDGVRGQSHLHGDHTIKGAQVSLTLNLTTNLQNGTTRQELANGTVGVVRIFNSEGRLIGQQAAGNLSPTSPVQGQIAIRYEIINGAAKPSGIAIDGPVVEVEYALIVEAGPPINIPGDINGDGSVGFADFVILSSNFGKDVPPGTNGDLDGNGKVEFFDFQILSSNYSK